MRLFHFHNQAFQFLIAANNFKNAFEKFYEGAAEIYGTTLRGCKLSSETDPIVIYWQEEGERVTLEDIFEVKILPEDSAAFISKLADESENMILKLSVG